MPPDDFDLRALYDALDRERQRRDLTWRAVAEEVNHRRTHLRPIAVSTITSLQQKPDGEGDGILQMLLWLRRTPESFVPGMIDPESDCFCRPTLAMGEILRWDTRRLFEALNTRRAGDALSWAEVARQIKGFTPRMLTNLSNGGRIGFPRVMRLVRWLGQPAATFTRIALAEGVGVIDQALGPGASTGTPFAAGSRRLDKPVPGADRVDIFSVVTVCARVSSPDDLPVGGEVHRETRKEVVFAQACPIADRDGCIDRLQMLLAQRLGVPAEDDRVRHLFWRAASSAEEPTDAAALARVLLAADKRRVHVAPVVNVSGNANAGAELSKPIEQQVQRPLIQARPSWFSVIAQPEDTWLVVAITLTDEMVQHLSPPQPEAAPPAT